jgi:hypothetical protein
MFNIGEFRQYVESNLPEGGWITLKDLIEEGLDKAPKHLWEHALGSVVKQRNQGNTKWNQLVKEQLRKMYGRQQPVTGFFTPQKTIDKRTREAVERLCMFVLLQDNTPQYWVKDGTILHSAPSGNYEPTKAQKHLMERLGTFYQVLTSSSTDQKNTYSNDVETIERKIRSLFQKMSPSKKALYKPHIEHDLAQLKQYHKKMK